MRSGEGVEEGGCATRVGVGSEETKAGGAKKLDLGHRSRNQEEPDAPQNASIPD